MEEKATTVTVSTLSFIITIMVSSVVILFIFNIVIACIFKCKKPVKSSDTSRYDVQFRSQQPTSTIYDTGDTVSATIQETDLRMTENVAYASVKQKLN